ncbi:MAG: amino acid transporter [Armatimonadetes bacterium]|nr:amino acid transporter [Armatimonadota bacterium]
MEIKLPSTFKSTKHSPIVKWLLEGHAEEPVGPYEPESSKEGKHAVHPWWQVMCLTGVDYFSTLGYQPFIAFEAAKYLSPLATIILVLLTLFGAYPVYAKVAQESPHGEGSIAMLQKLLKWWQGKAFVLVLLGFAATDFIITITLSAADAAVHFIENDFVQNKLHLHMQGHEIAVTLLLIISLALVFLKGFKEAVNIAIVLVFGYLVLNAIVIFEGIQRVIADPKHIQIWQDQLHTPKYHNGNPIMLIAMAALLFPKLALGLSGFETGVSVMTLVKGGKKDTEEKPVVRIKNTRKLLLSAALIMSVMLISSSIVTTTLIPAPLFEKGGPAYERALAYLAYDFFGPNFGTVYDVSTILILWFAGASAMAGLLNLVPRYLPKFGMAPEWTKANRPLVLIFTLVAFIVTLVFNASVSAQGGAYATGVLVLMTSAAIAATISTRRKKKWSKWGFGIISVIFIYTTVLNIYEKPDGIRIAACFILGIVLISFISRIWRTLELRVSSVELDLKALEFVRQCAAQSSHIRVIPNRPESQDLEEYRLKEIEARRDHDIAPDEPILFVEVTIKDASNFSGVLSVRGYEVEGYKILRATGVAVPNSLAALLLHLGRLSGKRAHAYFNWGERGPGAYLMKFLFSGEGDIAPLTREILRRVESDPNLRPVIHAAS